MTTKTIFKTLILTVTTALLSCSQSEVTPTVSVSFSYPKVEAGQAGSAFPITKPDGVAAYSIAPLKPAAGTPILPTIDTNTGEVTVTATTTAGTYQVAATVGGGDTYTAPFYVAIFASNRQDITNEIEGANTGVAMWGNNGNFNYLDTSAVGDMSYLFAADYSLEGTYNNAIRRPLYFFNGDISQWDVSQVTNMKYMFNVADFNGDISLWDVSKVTDMSSMFESTSFFNGDISDWNVGNVTKMTTMFNRATVFNQDLNNWNVGNVVSMGSMFSHAYAFNRDISSWDVGKVTYMFDMFQDATNFHKDISGWAVDQVTTMDNMFNGATTFTQDLEPWGDHLKGRTVTMTDMFTNSGVTSPPSWYRQ